MKYAILIAVLLAGTTQAQDAFDNTVDLLEKQQQDRQIKQLEYEVRKLESEQRYQQMQRSFEQATQHGMGGCTPNYSTGGCL